MITTQAQRASIGDFQFSATHDDGVDVVLSTLGGWGSPASTIEVVPNARANGGSAGDAWLASRYLTPQGTIIAPTRDLAVAKFDELVSRFALGNFTFTVVEGAVTRSLTVRRVGEVLHEVTGPDGSVIEWSVVLVAVDPRKFSTALTGATGLPSSVGGLSFPHTFPHTFDAVVSSGQITLTNPGNAAGRVVLRITAGVGGLTGPVVTHVSSGKSIIFASSLTLTEGTYVDVDMDAHTVLEQGIASRNGWVISRGWSQFQPGDNLWAFSATGGDGTLRVTAYPSWM